MELIQEERWSSASLKCEIQTAFIVTPPASLSTKTILRRIGPTRPREDICMGRVLLSVLTTFIFQFLDWLLLMLFLISTGHVITSLQGHPCNDFFVYMMGFVAIHWFNGQKVNVIRRFREQDMFSEIGEQYFIANFLQNWKSRRKSMITWKQDIKFSSSLSSVNK